MTEAVVSKDGSAYVAAKPGVKTSEFWKSIVVHVIALVIIAYGMQKGSDGIVGFGTILMGVTQGSYNIGRSVAKGGVAKLAHVVAKITAKDA